MLQEESGVRLIADGRAMLIMRAEISQKRKTLRQLKFAVVVEPHIHPGNILGRAMNTDRQHQSGRNSKSSVKGWKLTEEDFNFFMNWLSTNPEEAGRKFEALRRRLITFFDARACFDAEGLADKTIDRVMRKLPTLSKDFLSTFTTEANSIKDPKIAYCYRFAHYVHLDYLESAKAQSGEPDENLPAFVNPDELEKKELRVNCLEQCLRTLPSQKQQLLVSYFEKEKQAKVDHHLRLADQFGYSLNALRLQIHRLTNKMYDCISACQAGE